MSGSRPSRSASTSSSLSSRPSGSSSIAVARDAAAAPARVHVEQLGPREAEDQQRRLAHPAGEVLDQLEQRLLRPVDVLEHEHERLRVGELLRPLARGPRDLLLAALALDRLEHARRRARAGRRPPRPRSRPCSFSCASSTGSSSEIPAAAFTISASGQYVMPSPYGQAAAGEHRRALEPRDELAREPALAHARLAVERERGGRGGRGRRARRCSASSSSSRLAADERRRDAARDASRRRRRRRARPAAARRGRAARSGRPTRTRSRRARAGSAPGPTRISPGAAACCEARGDVDRLAGGEGRRRRRPPTTSPASMPIRACEPEVADGVEDRERGAHGALGVVLVRARDRRTRP